MSNFDNLGGNVSTTTQSWEAMVQKAWGSEFHAPDHGAYVFTGRKFDSTDKGRTGIYGVEVADGIAVLGTDSYQYPDMAPNVVGTVSGDMVEES